MALSGHTSARLVDRTPPPASLVLDVPLDLPEDPVLPVVRLEAAAATAAAAIVAVVVVLPAAAQHGRRLLLLLRSLWAERWIDWVICHFAPTLSKTLVKKAK